MALWQLFKLFLKIGSTGFGGYMALIAQVQSYAVERNKLLSQDDMLNGISLATILPGPVAVNTVAYAGYRIRGWAGAVVAATAVMTPSFLLMLLLTDAYFRWGSVPAVGKLFNGFIPAVAAVVLAAAWNMARKTTRTLSEGLIAAASCLSLIMVRGLFITAAIIAVSAVLGLLLFRRGQATGEQAAAAGVTEARRAAGEGLRMNVVAPVLSMPFLGTACRSCRKALRNIRKHEPASVRRRLCFYSAHAAGRGRRIRMGHSKGISGWYRSRPDNAGPYPDQLRVHRLQSCRVLRRRCCNGRHVRPACGGHAPLRPVP